MRLPLKVSELIVIFICFSTLFIPVRHGVENLAIAPVIAAALIGGGASLIGGWLSSRNKAKTPQAPDYAWLSQYGPGMWDYLRTTGMDWAKNPYGFDAKSLTAMREGAKESVWGGYEQANRDVTQQAALSGLSQSGGEADRRRYYAGTQAGVNLARSMGAIDIADYQEKMARQNQGMNILMALSNKNPIMQQYASQNYWNEVQQSNMQNSMLGGMAGNFMDYYLMNQYMQNNPYSGYSWAGGSNPTVMNSPYGSVDLNAIPAN